MFTGFTQGTFDFMWGLRFNNNRTWFSEHKEEYQRELQEPMKTLAAQVFDGVQKACGERGFKPPKVSRIYKDARRVRDGQPYRDHLWFSIEKPSEDWTATPVFWFELTPEGWRCGLGYYQARALTMMKLRARIDKNTKQFEKLVAPLKKRDDLVLEGDEYARKKDAPSTATAEWYNKKSFVIVCANANGEEVFTPELADGIIERFKFLMPIYDYLSTVDFDPDPREQV